MTRRWLPQRLLPQLMLLTTGALLISIVLYAFYTLREQTTISRLGIEQQASALARNLAISSAGTLVLGNIDVVDDLLERTADFPDVLELRLVDAEGQILSHFARGPGHTVKRLFDAPTQRLALPAAAEKTLLAKTVDGHERLIAWHPVKAGTLIGWVRVDFSTAALADIRQRITLTAAVAAVLSVAGSCLLLFLFLRRPMHALQHAQRFAVDLDHADGNTLPPIPAPMEIEDLAAALNYASVKLHEQRQQLAATIGKLVTDERTIRDRTEQLDAIFALSPDGFVSFDAACCVNHVNTAFLRMTGLAANEVMGLDEDAFSARLAASCAPGTPFGGVATMRRVLERETAEKTTADAGNAGTGKARQSRQLIELTTAGKRVIELKLRLADAATVSQILYLRDVTHEIEVDRMKSEFLSHAAHELRTPMTSIFGFTELLIAQEFDAETRKELLATIHQQTQWLVNIVNELLDLARIEARRGQDFHIEAVALEPLVNEVLASMQIIPERWPVAVSIPDALPPARADKAKLRQALTNVLGNAIKYSPNGGAIDVCCVMRISDDGDGKTLVGISITDHGIGMTPEEAARVGERFYRADTSGNIPGSGLGVTIVKEIVEILGGFFTVTSQPDQGSTFTLWLPAGNAAISSAPGGESPPPIENIST